MENSDDDIAIEVPHSDAEDEIVYSDANEEVIDEGIVIAIGQVYAEEAQEFLNQEANCWAVREPERGRSGVARRSAAYWPRKSRAICPHRCRLRRQS